MLRLLVQDVTLLRQEQIEINVRWKGGATSELRVPVPLNAYESRRTDPGVLKSIEAWAGTQTDEEIATRLNAEGKRTGSGRPFPHETVQRLRNERGIAGLREHQRRAGLRTTEEITRATGTQRAPSGSGARPATSGPSGWTTSTGSTRSPRQRCSSGLRKPGGRSDPSARHSSSDTRGAV